MTWFAGRRALAMLVGATIVSLIWWFGVGLTQRDTTTAQGKNAFTVSSFDADYTLSTFGKRAELNVTETIVAEFPAANGNHGITRSLPTTYRGRDMVLGSVKAELDGAPISVQSERTSTAVTARIGDPDQVLAGQHVFTISYSYLDVVSAGDAGQRFYWNINGLGWPQAIGSVSATITVMDPLSQQLTSTANCFAGGSGSTDRCEITRTDQGDGIVTYTTGSSAVKGHQTQTVEIGLAPDSVTTPALNKSTRTWAIVTGAITGLLAAATVLALIWAATRRRRAMGYDPGVVQFTPRDDLPPILAAALVGAPGRGVVAELLRAASEGYVQLAGGGTTGVPLTATLLEWPRSWRPESQRTLQTVVGSTQVGTSVPVAQRIDQLSPHEVATLRDLAPDEGLISRPDVRAVVLLLGAVAVLAPLVIIAPGRGLALPFWWIVAPVMIVVASVTVALGLAMRWQKLTPAGVAAYRYLNGLRIFLTASEADRIRVVQGAETSERVGAGNLVPIVEKLLPYAVALGLEDSWQRAVGTDLEPSLRWLPAGAITASGLGLTSTWAYRRIGSSYGSNQSKYSDLRSRVRSARSGSRRDGGRSSSFRSSGRSRRRGSAGGGAGGGGGGGW